MGQHTPGPWEHKGNRVYRKDSYEVAWIAGQGPHSEWQANATLIAAAPAMYEALKAIAGQQSPNRWGYDSAEIALDDEWRAQARAAIAQAEGKE